MSNAKPFLIAVTVIGIVALISCTAGRTHGDLQAPAATSAALGSRSPCGYAEPDPTPVAPRKDTAGLPTSTPAPTPIVEVEVPRYPNLHFEPDEPLPWLDAVVRVKLTLQDRSPRLIQGLVVDTGGLVLTSLDPRDTVGSIDVDLGGETYRAELVRYDPRVSAALLRVDVPGLVGAPRGSGGIQPGEPGFALVRDTGDSIRPVPVFVSPSVNAPDSLAALLSFRSAPIEAGVTITDRRGRIIGITQHGGWQWTGTSMALGGGLLLDPDQPVILLDSALALLEGERDLARTIPSALAYHWASGQSAGGRFVDGPKTRELAAEPARTLLDQIGKRLYVKGLGRPARVVVAPTEGTYVEMLYAEPQELRTSKGAVVAHGRYFVFWERQGRGPDLVLCGETPDRLGAAFEVPSLDRLKQVMDQAPRSSHSVVLAAPLPGEKDNFYSYPYKWALEVDLEADTGSYAPGEKVGLTMTVGNASEFPVPLDFMPPMVLIRGGGQGLPVALVPHGDSHGVLEPGQTATFEIQWNGMTAKGAPAQDGDYRAEALIANAWDFSGPKGPQTSFAIRTR